jgi:hypothetical protein
MNTRTIATTIEAFRENYSGGVALMAMRRDADGKQYAGEIQWREIQLGEMPRPTMQFHRMMTNDTEALQQLADSLWECGFRPSQTLGTAGEKQALERHLQDFRALAAHALKVQLPNR